MNCRGRIAAGADKNRLVGRQDESLWKKNHRLRCPLQAIVLRVPHNPNRLQPVIRSLREHKGRLVKLEHRAANALAEGTAVSEVLFYEGLIDKRQMSRVRDFSLVEYPAGQKRNVQSGE